MLIQLILVLTTNVTWYSLKQKILKTKRYSSEILLSFFFLLICSFCSCQVFDKALKCNWNKLQGTSQIHVDQKEIKLVEPASFSALDLENCFETRPVHSSIAVWITWNEFRRNFPRCNSNFLRFSAFENLRMSKQNDVAVYIPCWILIRHLCNTVIFKIISIKSVDNGDENCHVRI